MRKLFTKYRKDEMVRDPVFRVVKVSFVFIVVSPVIMPKTVIATQIENLRKRRLIIHGQPNGQRKKEKVRRFQNLGRQYLS